MLPTFSVLKSDKDDTKGSHQCHVYTFKAQRAVQKRKIKLH
jgi:hypothetical protein